MLKIKGGPTLQKCIDELQNVAGISGNSPGMDVTSAINGYSNWLRQAENALRNSFADPSLWESLYDDVYWRILEFTSATPRWQEIISRQMKYHGDRLETLRQKLLDLQSWLDSAPGKFAVLDSHVLLHFQPPDQVQWSEIVGELPVRLVLPLRVVEELDEKKYTARDPIAGRARGLLSSLRTNLVPKGGAPVQIRDDVTIEVPVEDGPRRRPLDADYEILTMASDLVALGRPVILITDDAGLAIRAAHEGLKTVRMPEKYLRVPRTSEGDSQRATSP